MSFNFVELKIKNDFRGRAYRQKYPITKFDEYVITQLIKAGANYNEICRFSRLHLGPDTVKRIQVKVKHT